MTSLGRAPALSRLVLAALIVLLASLAAPASADITLIVIADTHYGSTVPDSSQQNQLEAITTMTGRPYPSAIGGVVGPIDAVFVCGDLVHGDTPEQEPPYDFFEDYAGNGCTGSVPYPVYECSGNHDVEQVRDIIRSRHGELYYGVEIGGIVFQSLDDKPSVSAVAYANQRLSALPAGTPIILFHHRALSAPGGYINEWDPLAVNAYRDMCAGKNVIAVFFGHDHYSRYYNWEGIATYTPGSVRHSPSTPFPESFLVIRITATTLSCASWIFGNDITPNGQQHVWKGGAWGWTQQKAIQMLSTATASR